MVRWSAPKEPRGKCDVSSFFDLLNQGECVTGELKFGGQLTDYCP